MIYCGPTGHNSKQLVQFFQSLDGVPRIQEGINPATWMLEVTRPAEERRLGLDFAEVYQQSDLFRYAVYFADMLTRLLQMQHMSEHAEKHRLAICLQENDLSCLFNSSPC